MPRLLMWDCETSPIISYNWGIYDQTAIEVIEDTQILCFAYKWFGDRRTRVIGQDDFKSYKPGLNNDKHVIEALRGLFDEADVVIAHNGNSFDQKIAQARMMHYDLDPPTPYKQIDTKLVARRYGRFTSNKLDHLNKGFGFEGKIETGGFATWKGCLAGDPKSWAKMKRYNKKDVDELEKLYLRLRPWISNHPHIGILKAEREACPNCGGITLVKNGSYTSRVGRYQVWRCQTCRAHPRSRLADKTEKPAYV